MNPDNYRTQILVALTGGLRNTKQVKGVWEGGSAANSTSDQFSDIDLNILASEPIDIVFQTVERCLSEISPITHTWHEPKSIWPDLTQKVYFLEDSPKHFFIDCAVFPDSATEILKEFMQTERHGKPVVHFDDSGLIQSKPADKVALRRKQQRRFAEIIGAFPVYRTEVMKELDRGHAVDALAFYQGGMIRPLVELLGMLHRPFQFDFGLRYLERSLPAETFAVLQKLIYNGDVDDLRKNAVEADKLFCETVEKVAKILNQPI